jgi:hypothetical protein
LEKFDDVGTGDWGRPEEVFAVEDENIIDLQGR